MPSPSITGLGRVSSRRSSENLPSRKFAVASSAVYWPCLRLETLQTLVGDVADAPMARLARTRQETVASGDVVNEFTVGDFLPRQQGIKWRRRAKGGRVENIPRRAQNGCRRACRAYTSSTSPHTSSPPRRRRLIQAVCLALQRRTILSSSEGELRQRPDAARFIPHGGPPRGVVACQRLAAWQNHGYLRFPEYHPHPIIL